MSARVKSTGAKVSDLVDKLREQGATPPSEGKREGEIHEELAETQSDETEAQTAQEASPDPRELVKVVDKAPCDRLDDLADAPDQADAELVKIVEGLIFASPHPLHVREAVAILEDYEVQDVQAAFKVLSLGREGSGLQLARTAQGYRWTTDPAHAKHVQRLVMAKPQRLSRPQLETLAVIAYRQPVTRPEIDHIRGVDSQATLKALVDRELIAVVGQTADPGRPRLYGTTLFFLEYLNITELASLPPLGELSELSERTRELLRSKVGVDEAERLSAQVLAMAKEQDQAAAQEEEHDEAPGEGLELIAGIVDNQVVGRADAGQEPCWSGEGSGQEVQGPARPALLHGLVMVAFGPDGCVEELRETLTQRELTGSKRGALDAAQGPDEIVAQLDLNNNDAEGDTPHMEASDRSCQGAEAFEDASDEDERDAADVESCAPSVSINREEEQTDDRAGTAENENAALDATEGEQTDDDEVGEDADERVDGEGRP